MVNILIHYLIFSNYLLLLLLVNSIQQFNKYYKIRIECRYVEEKKKIQENKLNTTFNSYKKKKVIDYIPIISHCI